MELEDSLISLLEGGVKPYAISYDPVETLAEFSARHGIDYPLLSDSNGTVMKTFGIFNNAVPKDHHWYGIPYPGTYMVDERGIVFDRSFFADHITRDSIARMTQETFRVPSASHGTIHKIESTACSAGVYLSADTIRRGQVHTLIVELDIRDGYHVQAAPLPDGYVPFTIEIDPIDGVTVDPFDYPEPRSHHIPGIDDQLHVYESLVTLKTGLRFNVREDVALKICLEAQACTLTYCLPPEKWTFEIPLKWLPSP